VPNLIEYTSFANIKPPCPDSLQDGLNTKLLSAMQIERGGGGDVIPHSILKSKINVLKMSYQLKDINLISMN